MFPGIIGFSDQYHCYDETVIEFVVWSLKETYTITFPHSLILFLSESSDKPSRLQQKMHFNVTVFAFCSHCVHIFIILDNQDQGWEGYFGYVIGYRSLVALFET